MEFAFGDHRLDLERRELWCADELVAVEPQVFDLLAYLIRNRDRVVSKDDLLAAIWDGRIVAESTLTSRINAARKAVGDNGGSQRAIRTMAQGRPLCRRGRGGRRHERPNETAAGLSQHLSPSGLPLPDKPAIAVLPFADLNGGGIILPTG